MKEDYAKLYTELHRNEKAFAGRSIRTYVPDIAELVRSVQPARILDYGSGKGYQYLQYRVHEAWGGILPYCYDVGVRQLSERPQGKFEGVICTDVMEHIAEEDVEEVLAGIFSFVGDWQDDEHRAFAFFSIACRPAAKKRLPDGRDVHLTVKSPAFWLTKLAQFQCDGLIIRSRFDEGSATK